VTREIVAINANPDGNDWNRPANLRLGRPVPARAVRPDPRGRR
jgi:hypothetical protein